MASLPSASEQYARDLTDRIRNATESLYSLLLEAWESECFKHLGYKSWSAYIDGEFDFNRQHSYRLLTAAKATKQLQAAAEELSPKGDTRDEIHIPERVARDIAAVLPAVIEDVKSQVAAGVSTERAVEAAVERGRQAVRLQQSKPEPMRRGARFEDEPEDDLPTRDVHEHVWVCSICGEAQ